MEYEKEKRVVKLQVSLLLLLLLGVSVASVGVWSFYRFLKEIDSSPTWTYACGLTSVVIFILAMKVKKDLSKHCTI